MMQKFRFFLLRNQKIQEVNYNFLLLVEKSMQHSLRDAPIASETNGVCGKKFPLVILSHGLTGFRHIYSSFCTDLASHGFLVASVAVSYTHLTLPTICSV